MAKAAKLFIQVETTDEPQTQPPVVAATTKKSKTAKEVTPVEVVAPKYIDYYDSRMLPLGITEDCEENKINVGTTDCVNYWKIFTRHAKGIKILVYTIEGKLINYKTEAKEFIGKDGNPHFTKQWSKEYAIIRLEVPKVKPNGDEQKYDIPAAQMVQPFFPPALVDKYKKKEKGVTLYMTEGYIKAFFAQKCGIDCVGIPSITTMRNKATGRLHEDIIKLIVECKYERLVWLTDGDCRDITSKEISDGTNLTKRPNNFFDSVIRFHDLCSKMENVQLYFSHIHSYALTKKSKGIDDVLLDYKEQQPDIINELLDFSTIKQEYTYIVRFHITGGISTLKQYFYLHDVNHFYMFHCERRPELKNTDFRYYGTLYRYDDDKHNCIVLKPGGANLFIRVGDTYYEKLRVPDHLGSYYDILAPRAKETITDDHTKDVIKHIEKFRGFVNIPNHINYQPKIDNFWNKYNPINHVLEEGDCSNNIEFIKHIFGTEKIQLTPEKTIERWEMALDYLTILWSEPTHILPILCLVSEERQTGKTKFLEWLCYLFCENAIIIGNADLENKFNSHWNGKLIIGVDETKIERLIVMEKIKALSTSSFIIDEGKGKDQQKAGFFGKFILNSNNVRNFANIDDKEIRFWVIDVPTVKKRDVDLIDILKDEAPAFLSFLSKREIICPRVERHWFESRILKTAALNIVVENSKPTVEKTIVQNLVHLFEATDYHTIKMGLDDVLKYLAKMQEKDKTYVKNILNTMGYKTQPAARNVYFPVMVEQPTENRIEYKIFKKNCIGRYYEFNRKDFITDETTTEPTQEIKGVADIL